MSASADLTLAETAFSAQLRAATAAAHQRAERADFVTALLKGELDREALMTFLVQQLHLYAALEEVGASLLTDPVAGGFVDPALDRAPALHDDLALLIGPGYDDEARMLPATRRYVDRIREVASWPGGFVAHHYTRYLGDLSGGLVLGKTLVRRYGLRWDAGARFYVFDQIPDPASYKAAYRARLDAVPWDAAERQRVVDEANTAFDLNAALFADLQEARAAR